MAYLYTPLPSYRQSFMPGWGQSPSPIFLTDIAQVLRHLGLKAENIYNIL